MVAELDGRIVGNFVVVPVEMSGAHTGLARPPGLAHLGYAAVLPEARGSGAGLALTAATFAWAREQGYGAMVTDWRVTNLLSSRFWPKRGFRTTFLRLYRSIP
jgi:GNAT superfamily N-acetyltransferase